MSLNIDLNKQDKRLCDEFENKIIQSYDGYLSTQKYKLEQIGNQLIEINKLFENNSYLGKFALHLMKLISNLNQKWLSFYPTFSFTYKSRKDVLPSENVELVRLRNSFDKIYTFTHDLANSNPNSRTRYNTTFDNVDNNFKVTKTLLNELIDKMTVYEDVLILNKNITFSKNTYTGNNTTIDDEEITAFQNEFIYFEKIMKNYINKILKEVKITHAKYTMIKRKLNADIDEIQDKTSKITSYKFEFVKNILKIIK